MWVFDRSLTEYENNIPIFIDTILENKYVQNVFVKLSKEFNRPIESIKNTYASPIFRLGIAYKVNIGRLNMGQLSINPSEHGFPSEEYRLTETARLYSERKIPLETFFLANVIRFQSLNSTLQRNYFNQLLNANHRVLPLLLCLQVLRELKSIDLSQSYITIDELPWLTEKTSQSPADIKNYAAELIKARLSNTSLTALPSSNAYVDAWFKWFHATRVVIDCRQIPIGENKRVRALVLSTERSMVVDRILNEPPTFIPLSNFEERYKWATEYIKAPSNLNNYLPPKDPLIIKIDLPSTAMFNSDNRELNIPWTLAASFTARNQSNFQSRRGTLLALGNQIGDLTPSIVYEVISVSYPGDGTGNVIISPAMQSVDKNQNIAQIIHKME